MSRLSFMESTASRNRLFTSFITIFLGVYVRWVACYTVLWKIWMGQDRRMKDFIALTTRCDCWPNFYPDSRTQDKLYFFSQKKYSQVLLQEKFECQDPSQPQLSNHSLNLAILRLLSPKHKGHSSLPNGSKCSPTIQSQMKCHFLCLSTTFLNQMYLLPHLYL